MTKKLALITLVINIMSCTFANSNLEGTYSKTEKSTKIYLKIKNIKDSLYYFILKDYDTTKENYQQRWIVGSFIYSSNKCKLFNAECYPYHHFSILKKSTNILTIDSSYFHMYFAFDDIKGNYIKESDSVNINYSEYKIYKMPNNIDAAKITFETVLYEFPSKFSKGEKIKFDKNEKVYTITTVGGFLGSKPLPSDMIRFSLIEIPRLKIRNWINTDELEDKFK
ncbi:MAG: hypothetical protein K2Q21_10570 [Chitinophagaceae bacterium]|nr:hypothetical protein [Chitinophagaceae bacterium]